MQRAPVFFVAITVVLSFIATSADGASVNGKPELQYDAPDVEKILHEVNRYLYRQRQRHALDEQPEEEDDSSELSRLVHQPDDAVDGPAMNKQHRYRPRLSWPFWSAKTESRTGAAGAPWEGGPADAPLRSYEKRNSELINSLLGLPRIMKVVG